VSGTSERAKDHVAAASVFLRVVVEELRRERDAQPQYSLTGRRAAWYLDEAASAVHELAWSAEHGPSAASAPRPPNRRRQRRSAVSSTDLVLF